MENTAVHDFKSLVQGSDWNVTLDFTISGVIKPLTGYTGKMTIRDSDNSDGNVLITLTTVGAAGIIITEATGRVTLFITAAQSALFTWTEGYYDLFLTDTATGLIAVPIRGKFTVVPRITV